MLVILPVTEGAVVSSVCVVGLADAVVVKLDREWYIEEEAEVLLKMLFVLVGRLCWLMLVVDETAGIRILCSPLPGAKKNIYVK